MSEETRAIYGALIELLEIAERTLIELQEIKTILKAKEKK